MERIKLNAGKYWTFQANVRVLQLTVATQPNAAFHPAFQRHKNVLFRYAFLHALCRNVSIHYRRADHQRGGTVRVYGNTGKQGCDNAYAPLPCNVKGAFIYGLGEFDVFPLKPL